MSEQPIIVVGSGIAGLWTALSAAPRPVLLLTAGAFGRQSASAWAQGGIAAALGEADRPALHAADTVAAGAGASDPVVARELAERVVAQVEALERLGVPFERGADGRWALSREAAHSRPRVARIGGDRAGAAIVEVLTRAVASSSHVRVREHAPVCGLASDAAGGCRGVVLDTGAGSREVVAGGATVLATGGLGGLYALTTNPPGNQGQALAWADRLGARVRDAEFVQFHPTAIDVGRHPAPLATEALRGEGAVLIDRGGRRFMPALHPDAELAPRDVVARAVHRQVQSGRGAFLDARQAVGALFPQRFEAVFRACMAAGIDPRHETIPVAPAAHYHMGGIAAGLDGRTDVDALFAVGEVACTGLHGANRLASNSLAEALVMGSLAGARLKGIELRARAVETAAGPAAGLSRPALATLRAAMSAHAGVERDSRGLNALLERLAELEFTEGPADALAAARLVATAALARPESLGAHCRSDDPGHTGGGRSNRGQPARVPMIPNPPRGLLTS